MKYAKRLVVLWWFATAFPQAFAQGGPPMITDDPFTPGDGRWEINLAAQLIANAEGEAWQIPSLDLNYGYGPRLQLNVLTSYSQSTNTDGSRSSGVGQGSFAIKWRFYGDDESPVAISIYPRLDSRFPFSSHNSELAGDGNRYFLPAELATKLGSWSLNPEVGYAHYTRENDEWDYGVVLGHEWQEGREILFEVHARQPLGGDVELLAQIGSRFQVARWLSLIGALGHSVRETRDEGAFWIVYAGIQLRI